MRLYTHNIMVNSSINSLNLARNMSRIRDQAHEFPVNAIKQMAEMGECLIYRAKYTTTQLS